MHRALHPRDNVDIQYVPRKEERGLASIKDSVDALIERLVNYPKRCRGRRITLTRNNTENTNISKTKIIRKQK